MNHKYVLILISLISNHDNEDVTRKDKQNICTQPKNICILKNKTNFNLFNTPTRFTFKSEKMLK